MTETKGPMEGAIYMEGMHGCEIHSSDREKSITPFEHIWAYGWHFWDSYIASPNSPNGWFNLPPASHPPPPPTPTLPLTHPPL